MQHACYNSSTELNCTVFLRVKSNLKIAVWGKKSYYITRTRLVKRLTDGGDIKYQTDLTI